ncbi:hypothetical protein PsorP6_012712 [Peronosclerospora sorghi]|uniref:Uncharacterized protein n=1 Tax=Peronosclerospora sorghi TaxID=230839 RepID=A0ACC0WHL8_9STRA|nr:hypothetical protein PsorP6_012712 [Peronosclerospora sorghi]
MGLLKELYKNHPPDKLKNVSTVAKQYAGKERELVGLFTGNYGALSVRRLEENLDVLERSHQARMSSKESRKQRALALAGFEKGVSKKFSVDTALNSHLDDDMTSSHQLQTNDIDNESDADYAGSDVSLTEKVNKKEGESAAVAPYASEHNPVEEENDAFMKRIEAEEKEQVMKKIMDIPKLEEMSLTDDPESIEISADDNLTKGYFLRAIVYEIESVSDAKDVNSAVTETEGETVAVAIEDVSFNDDEEIPNVAYENIIAENIKAEAESVVEVEMRQEGL